jgi:hypothetical protein
MLEALSDPCRRILMRAAARMGMHGAARNLPAGVVSYAAERSIWDALLLAPFVRGSDRADMLELLPVDAGVEMARHEIYSWPIVWAACETLGTASERGLRILEAAEWDVRRPPREELPLDVAHRVLTNPANYPWRVLVVADRSLERSRQAPHLRDVAENEAWFEEDD